MRSSRLLLKNTLMLAGGSVLLRAVGLCFQMYLAAKVGAEGLGIYGLITSVYIVFATISVSGIRFAVTRLTAEEIGYGNEHPHKIVRYAFFYALFFGSISFLVLFLFSGVIAEKWIFHTYAVLPLKLLSVSLPFVGTGAVFEGYFTAKQKISRLVLLQLLNQVIRIFSTVYILSTFPSAQAHPCDVLAFSTLLGEVFFALFSFILYMLNSRRHKEKKYLGNVFTRLIYVAVPLAVSAYMRTGLSSLGHVIIPFGFRKAGMGSSGAFITYGIITQMAFPIIMFPASLLVALGEILVPRLTEAQVNRRYTSISYMTSRANRLGYIFSILIFGIMFFFPNILGQLCKSTEAALYIKVFAPLIPVMYCDSVTDGCLKGLGQQLYCMILNIIEAVINIVLLLILLPRYAIMGYIITVYVKEIFNTVLSYLRLQKITKLGPDIPMHITVLLCSFFAFPLSIIMSNIAIIRMACYVLIYISLLYIFNSVTRSDLRWSFSIIKNKDESV